MVKPQQPELRRSDRGATSDDAIKEQLTAPHVPRVGGDTGPIPADNQPGHHPVQEQDKPSGKAFVEKTHALAAQAPAGSAPTRAARVIYRTGVTLEVTGRAVQATGRAVETVGRTLAGCLPAG